MNCHFPAMCVTLLNINVHFTPLFIEARIPFKALNLKENPAVMS